MRCSFRRPGRLLYLEEARGFASPLLNGFAFVVDDWVMHESCAPHKTEKYTWCGEYRYVPVATLPSFALASVTAGMTHRGEEERLADEP